MIVVIGHKSRDFRRPILLDPKDVYAVILSRTFRWRRLGGRPLTICDALGHDPILGWCPDCRQWCDKGEGA